MLLNPYRFGPPPLTALQVGLVSYWKLDEASGNAIDAFGTNTLTDVNAVGSAAGKIGTARNFSGASSHNLAKSVSGADLSTGDIDFTFSVWVKFTGISATQVILNKWVDSGSQFELLLRTSSSSDIQWHVGNITAQITAPGFQVGVWYHLVAWHDAVNNQVGLKVNNTSYTATYSGGTTARPTIPFRIGARDTATCIDGQIDEVGFWKRMLTLAERTQLYNSGNGYAYPFDGPYTPPPPLQVNLISYWKLDEASGNAIDAHGMNTLTDVNTVASAAGKIGTARDFEVANSEYFNCASNASLQTGDIDFTVAAWVKLESKPTFVRIVTRHNNTVAQEYALSYDAGVDRFVFATTPNGGTVGDVYAADPGSPSIGVWYYVVAWYDSVADTRNIQVNNGAVSSVSGINGPAATSARFLIGALDHIGTPIQFMDGLIDEVGFWKRILTPAERTQLYNSGNGLTYPFT